MMKPVWRFAGLGGMRHRESMTRELIGWVMRPADAIGLCKVRCQTEEESRGGRGGDLWGGETVDDTLVRVRSAGRAKRPHAPSRSISSASWPLPKRSISPRALLSMASSHLRQGFPHIVAVLEASLLPKRRVRRCC